MKHWVQDYFARLMKGERTAESFFDKVSELSDFNRELYLAGDIGTATYCGLLLVSRIFQLGRQSQSYRGPEMTFMVGAFLGAFGAPGPEDFATGSLKMSSRRAASAFERAMQSIPAHLLQKHLDWRQSEVFRGVLQFAYFGYAEFHRKLLDQSGSNKQWHANLSELRPYVCMRLLIPLEALMADANFPLSTRETTRLLAELKQLEEIKANVFPMLLRFESKSSPGIGERIKANQQEFQKVLKEKGRIEARKYLIFQHSNRLWMPTYQYEALCARLQRHNPRL